MAIRLLNSVTTTGVGSSYSVRKGILDHTVQATWTGNPTAVRINLEGSLDNSTFYQLATHNCQPEEITNQSTMFHVTSKMVDFVRLNLETFTGGTSLTGLYDGDGI